MANVANLAPTLTFHSFLSSGAPNAFGTVNTYAAGTNTPIATYTDWTAGTPNPNPNTLNARGEMPMYLLSNVAYKIVEADSFGNSIKTTDQVVNNQLITLYGGVDTGIVNAYILTFAANFTAYTDGIVIYWIPSHTNTGASTINVNGLGVVNITNADGTAIAAGAIVANQPSELIFKGGAFLLVTPVVTSSGSFTGTFTGFTVATTATLLWVKTGNVVTLALPGFGPSNTSNAVTLTMTGLPAAIAPIRAFGSAGYCNCTDNGVALTTPGSFSISPSLLAFSKDATGNPNNWTAAGIKGINGFQVTYFLI